MENFIKYLLTMILLASGSGSAQAQDLIDIYRLALQQDAELQIAESDYRAAAQGTPLASSAGKPQIDFQTFVSIKESNNSTTGNNTSGSIGSSINLLQNIYNAEIIASIDGAEANTARALALLEEAQQNLIIRVAESYFDILAAQDNVDFANAEKAAIARQLEQAQKRFEVGLIAITDVREAQARYDSTLAQALSAENLLENAFQALQVIISEPPARSLARLGDRLNLDVPDPANSQLWVNDSLKNNRSLVAALAALRAADFDRQRFSKRHYPTLDFNASYSYTDTDFSNAGNSQLLNDSTQDDLILSLQLNVPLFTGGRISAEREQAEFTYQSAQNTALLQRRLTSQQTRIAYNGVLLAISQVQAFKQALESSTTALEATEAGFDVGTRTSVDVLVSLQETYRAQRDYAGARYDYLINILKLKQAAGLLTENDLRQINLWLSQ